MKKKKTRAIAMLSGGLDSALAVKMVLDQGVDVIGVKFSSPFCTCDQGGRCFSKEVAESLGIPYKTIPKGKDYIKIIRNPKHGHGSGINPCIDCRIYILKKAKKLAEEIGAEFIVTGEVLGQRPMSQHSKALKIIEKEAGLEGRILRPLSAKVLPETKPEKAGVVDRTKLESISGRSRKQQLALAEALGIKDYACPAGGCLLTEKAFARKMRDLFAHKKRVSMNDIMLIKIGRHFRFKTNRIIVGRNPIDGDYVFFVFGQITAKCIRSEVSRKFQF